jgi:membrane fusion protein (multidrug efflux system)
VAQVRARAAGILQKRLFREGSDVKAGQALFRSTPPLCSATCQRQATLARAQANLMQASALAERYKPLVAAKAISQQEFANAVAAQKQAEADVAVARQRCRPRASTWGTPASRRRFRAASAAPW